MSRLRHEGARDPDGSRIAGARVRVAAFVGGGPIALAALAALSAVHDVVVITRAAPVHGSGGLGAHALRVARALGIRPEDPVMVWARRVGVPVLEWSPGDEVATARRIEAHSAEVGCIATFPRRIPTPLLLAAGHSCLNLHPSLLPRHRGPDPLFWMYHAGDLEGGMSVHFATDRVDAGPVLVREALPIARGEPVAEVHARCAAIGGMLLTRAISLIGAGMATSEPQDESRATPAPRVGAGTQYSDLTRWSCAQAWHFLSGLSGRYQDPLVDTAGQPVRYTRVEGFEVRSPRFPPGAVVAEGTGWAAWTPDGVVRLSSGSVA